ncbi:hypothetical protein [Ectopseudomonas mendocina]|uniref:hypothetical protein n=1 Tax=Ectopseudomonas mendocina TaxID=300 RepID=UPI002446D2E4|nr:hypothetical protein [Pseudomonas chengduensis]MDH1869268.1 hypothetical protein [Pseudomonas chengduensis]
MSRRDINRAITYLAELPDNRKVFKVTWAMLEKFTGFSRQALHANAEIKKAFALAKHNMVTRADCRGLRSGGTRTNQETLSEIAALRDQLEKMKAKEAFWKQRWYRIAYNIRLKGLQMEKFDRAVPFIGPAMKAKEIQAILDEWNEEIPAAADRPE